MKEEIPQEVSARFHNLENVVVSNRSTAAAGARLLSFPSDREKETIALPTDLATKAKKGTVDLVTLEGDSLEGIGIFHGDQVLCQTTFTKRQIKPHHICIVYLHETDETLAKSVAYKQDSVILRSYNARIPDIVLRPEQVEVQGIVLKLLREPDAFGSFVRVPEPDVVNRIEKRRRVAQAIQSLQKPPVVEEWEF